MKINTFLLKKLRKEKAWTQEELAIASVLSERTIQRIEREGKASFDSAKSIAAAFNIDVSELDEAQNSSAVNDEEINSFLFRIDNGTKLGQLIGGSLVFRFEHDDPKTEKEADLLASTLQTIQDWGEIWSELESGARVKASFSLSQVINELEENDFWMFGSNTNEEYAGISKDDWRVANISVLRIDNPKIVKLDLSEEK